MRYMLFLSLAPITLAIRAPLLSRSASPVDRRASAVVNTLPTQITDTAGAIDASTNLLALLENSTLVGAAIPPAVSQVFLAVEPTSTPTSISDARNVVASQLNLTEGVSAAESESGKTSQDILTNVLGLLLNGIKPSDFEAILAGAGPAENNVANIGNPDVNKTIYPQAGPDDAPYSLSETVLREAIFIPSNFTFGEKIPVVLISGTASLAGATYSSSIARLLVADGRFDPVYVNVAGENLADITQNAEFSAYSANYIAALTGRKTAFITWSQGSLDVQWAMKYWPSVQDSVTDSINISPDYHGTIEAYILCNGLTNLLACDPAVIQQDYESNFVHQLRANGGDSAYVPTTTIYSLTDEIVQPQEGTNASGFINDARGVGVSNNFLQEICAGQPAGGIYTHEGVIYNPVTWALILDALTNDGPGDFTRVTTAPCQDVVAPGLSLDDVIDVEALVPFALFFALTFPGRSFVEPALPAYATF